MKTFGKRLTVMSALFAVLLCLGAGSARAAEKSYSLQVGGIQSSEDFATLAMQRMADLAKEKSGGSIAIEVFPASQLGDAMTQIEAVGMGSQDMFVDAGGFLATFAKNKNMESMFFLFDSEAHYRKFLDSDVTKDIEDAFLKATGARVIAHNWVRVPRCIASKKPITGLADFTGLKMRVPDIKAYLDSIKALGASPTQVAWGETYLALKQGVVDAAEGPLDALFTMNFYEATKNVTLSNHLRDNLVVTINDAKFGGMSDAQKKALADAAKEAGDWYSAKCKDAAETNVKKMKDAGTAFHEIDIAPLREAVLKRARELENEGAWSKGLLDRVLAAEK